MTIGSIIIFGILSTILLVFSCILLNAPKFYNELSSNTNRELVLKPQMVLRDRQIYRLEDLH